MNLTGYDYGDDIASVEQTKTEVQKNKSRIEIEKSATEQSKIQNPKFKIVEWYENTASGLEQGWTISEKPAETNGGELNLVLELGGDLRAKLQADGQAIYFHDKKGAAVLRYDKLKSWDADGKELASRMELDGKRLSIVVDDADAKYPITVDPFFTQTKKIVAADAAAGDNFGRSVAISGDTAIVGANLKDVAAPPRPGSKTSDRKGLSSESAAPDSPTAGAD